MLENEIEYQKMADTEGTLWWYRCLHELTTKCLRKHGVLKDSTIIDAACGTGGLLDFLKEDGFSHAKGFDLSPHAVNWCMRRGLDAQLGDVRNIETLYSKESADAIICNDAFCYLTEDEWSQTIRQFANLLLPRGTICLNLPALDAFSGMHDMSVGIQHRFSLRDIPCIFPTGFKIVETIYWPFLLSPLIWATRTLQRSRMKRDPDIEIKSDVEIPSSLQNILLYLITAFENKFFPAKPFGSSLFVVAKKL